MNKVLTSVCGGAALLALLTGCDPSLAQVGRGSEEELWYKQLKENYRSFEPPPTPAPAVYSRTAAPAGNGTAVVPPADDPEKVVDRAANGENVKPVPVDDNKAKTDKADAKNTKAAAGEAGKDKAVKADAKAGAEAKAVNADAKNVEGRFYVVKAGDTLGSIAKHFYGKASMEDMIFRANSKLLKNRNTLRIGMRLAIPEL
jgi:nucleoid-associated protein YgaU